VFVNRYWVMKFIFKWKNFFPYLLPFKFNAWKNSMTDNKFVVKYKNTWKIFVKLFKWAKYSNSRVILNEK
jgi:hypothetical protein